MWKLYLKIMKINKMYHQGLFPVYSLCSNNIVVTKLYEDQNEIVGIVPLRHVQRVKIVCV